MPMVKLDESQEKTLSDMAEIFRRSRGDAFAESYLRKVRRIGIFGLSLWRFFRPRHYQDWNLQRTGGEKNDR